MVKDKSGVTAWSPLGGGVLTGKYNKNITDQQQQQQTSSSSTMVGAESNNGRLYVQIDLANRFLNDKNILIAQEVFKLARKIKCTPSQVALNWIRQQKILPQQNKIFPMIGSRKESQIKDNLACLEFKLSNEQVQRLNEISKIELGFPHDFLNSEMVKEIIHGGTFSLIQNPGK
jgi:aryl-alcohol dehydrogenase-like predicted oxidoreductase